MKQPLFRALFRSARDRARELEEEIQTHIEMRIEDLVASGMDPTEAEAVARQRFGDLEQARKTLLRESSKRDRSVGFRERRADVTRDVVVATRRMRKYPGRTFVSVFIFALAIALTTVMFTVVDHVLIRPLAFPEADRLVELQSMTEERETFSQVSMGNWVDWREAASTLESTALVRSDRVTVRFGDEPQSYQGVYAAGDFFVTLRPHLVLGRGFTEDDGLAVEPIVVVSEDLWRTSLGATEDLDGLVLNVDGVQRSVVGVLGRETRFPDDGDLWIPAPFRPETGALRNNVNYQAVARLGPGVLLTQAESELSGVADGIRARDPEGIYSWGVGVRPLQVAVAGSTLAPLRMLMGAVLVVLLVACGNLMGLGFSRAKERLEEMAIRRSLGSTRARVIQQLLTEQLVVALVGGVTGLLLAVVALDVVLGFLGGVVPGADTIGIDGRIAAVAVLATLTSGVVAGLAPALRASSGDASGLLAQARTVRGGGGLSGATLVVAEVALTVVLLAGGVLLLQSMASLLNRDLGFEADAVVTLDMSLSQGRFWEDPSLVSDYWDQAMERVNAIPGVVSVAAGTGVPTGGGGATFIGLPDDPNVEGGARYRVINDTYFTTLGSTLVAGRPFGVEDQQGSPRVAIINRSMAERFWPGQDPIGQVVKAPSMEEYWFGGEAPWITVVGVVEDLREFGHEDDPSPTLYTLYRQIPQLSTGVTVLVKAPPSEVGRIAQLAPGEVLSVDPSIPVDVGFLDARLGELLRERRLLTGTLVGFAIVALALAGLGLYGLLAFAVVSRSRELALRAALGADRTDLAHLVGRAAAGVVGIGLLLGAAGAFVLRRVLNPYLVDVTLLDPLTGAWIVIALLAGALAAVFGPVLRAARMDPGEALRSP